MKSKPPRVISKPNIRRLSEKGNIRKDFFEAKEFDVIVSPARLLARRAAIRLSRAAPSWSRLPERSLFAGLPPEAVEKLGEINRQGVAILLVEQNAAMALRLAQRGYVLETGSIVLSSKTDELLQNDYVRRSYLGK